MRGTRNSAAPGSRRRSAEFRKLYDRDNLPWVQQASFDRGSFASLLGVRVIDEGQLIQVLSIGDSLAVLCDGDCIKATFPLAPRRSSTARRNCSCTNPAAECVPRRRRYRLRPRRRLDLPRAAAAGVAVHDRRARSLAAVAARHNPSPISVLRKLRTPKAFARFVKEERAAGRMKRDDTTLIALW